MNKIRIAWWDRKEKKYDYGAWHQRDRLLDFKKWVSIQNIKYLHVFYWIEALNNKVVVNLSIGKTENNTHLTERNSEIQTTTPKTVIAETDNIIQTISTQDIAHDFVILPALVFYKEEDNV